MCQTHNSNNNKGKCLNTYHINEKIISWIPVHIRITIVAMYVKPKFKFPTLALYYTKYKNLPPTGDRHLATTLVVRQRSDIPSGLVRCLEGCLLMNHGLAYALVYELEPADTSTPLTQLVKAMFNSESGNSRGSLESELQNPLNPYKHSIIHLI